MTRTTRTLSLTISMDNDAFGDPDKDQWHQEAARILRAAAKRIENGDDSFSLFDENGNKVGAINAIVD